MSANIIPEEFDTQEDIAADGDLFSHYNSMSDEDLDASISSMTLDIIDAEQARKDMVKAYKDTIKAIAERRDVALRVKRYRRNRALAGRPAVRAVDDHSDVSLEEC